MGRQALRASRVLSRVRPGRSTNRQLLLHGVRRGHLVPGTGAVDGRAARRRSGRRRSALGTKPRVLQQIRPVSLSGLIYAATQTAKTFGPRRGRPICAVGRVPRMGRLARRPAAQVCVRPWLAPPGIRTANTDFTDSTDFTGRAVALLLLCKSVKSVKSAKSAFAVPCCALRPITNRRRAMTLTRRKPSRAVVVCQLSQDYRLPTRRRATRRDAVTAGAARR